MRIYRLFQELEVLIALDFTFYFRRSAAGYGYPSYAIRSEMFDELEITVASDSLLSALESSCAKNGPRVSVDVSPPPGDEFPIRQKQALDGLERLLNEGFEVTLGNGRHKPFKRVYCWVSAEHNNGDYRIRVEEKGIVTALLNLYSYLEDVLNQIDANKEICSD